MANKIETDVAETPPKLRGQKPWEKPEVTPIGRAADILRQGGGKISVIVGDPGEPKKVPPTG